MRISTAMILMAACCQIAFASANWPNEPAGATLVLDCPFSGSICPTMFNTYKSGSFIVDPTAPTGGTNQVLDDYMPVGTSMGSGSGIWGVSFSPLAREVYTGAWWKTNADFEGSQNSFNKLWYVGGQPGNNSVLMWSGQQGAQYAKVIHFYFQTVENNCHVSGYSGDCYTPAYPSGSGSLAANVNSSAATLAAGSGWHQIELYQKASTSSTSQNGIIRWWVDGVLCGNYTNLNYSPGGFDNVQINHAWDGSHVRNQSVSWHHYWDQMRMSLPNSALLNPTRIQLTPLLPSAEKNKTLQLTATIMDQNGFPLVNQPPITWSTTGANTIANGLFTAGSATGDFTVTASSGNLTAFTAVKVMDFVAVNLKINCGDNSPSVPGWEPDLPYLVSGQTGDSYDFIGTFSTAGVANAAPAELYSTVRHYNHAYSFPACPNGNYLVRMHFSDKPAAGRAMDYTIEGVKVIDNLDIMKEAGGAFKALVKEFNVVVSDNNGLQIAGNQDAGNDVFEAGIEIIRNGTAGLEARKVIGTVPNGIQISALGNGRITIQAPGMQDYSVTVYDCEGRSKAIASAKGNSSPVISGLRNGVYFVKVQGMHGTNKQTQYGQIMLMR